ASVSAGNEANLTGQGPAVRLFGSSATPNFLDVLGSPVVLGRTFKAGEELPGRGALVIISHSLWIERFGGQSSAIGRIVRINEVDREVVGVMPAGFSYPSAKVQ